MTENKYSASIKKAIVDFANSCKGKYCSKIVEGKIWLQTPYTATSFYKFPYKPEVRLTQKTKEGTRHTIFEILDSQLKVPNLIIADIIQALFVEGTQTIVFITPTDEGYEKARELSQTIAGLLINRLVDAIPGRSSESKIKKIIERYALPEVVVYKISQAEARNINRLKELFANWSKKDKW